MARYEDYVKNAAEAQAEADEAPTGLDAEIQEAGDAQAERQLEIPESVLKRFSDKSPEEILESYAHLEQAYSQQGNKMGELRKSFDDYIVLQSQTPSEPEPDPEPVSVDDLYDDPEAAISQVVERQTRDKLSALESELEAVRRERYLAEFERKHPNVREVSQSPEFIEWVQGSPYRMKLAQQADGFDLDAAEQLFGLYEETTSSQQQVRQTAKRKADLRNASLESPSPDSPQLDEQWSRSEIIDRKLRAKLGDNESKVWLQKNSEAIAIAYEEGRVID